LDDFNGRKKTGDGLHLADLGRSVLRPYMIVLGS
jgi:hypothetical protein